jgi:hypothetical protein
MANRTRKVHFLSWVSGFIDLMWMVCSKVLGNFWLVKPALAKRCRRCALPPHSIFWRPAVFCRRKTFDVYRFVAEHNTGTLEKLLTQLTGGAELALNPTLGFSDPPPFHQMEAASRERRHFVTSKIGSCLEKHRRLNAQGSKTAR